MTDQPNDAGTGGDDDAVAKATAGLKAKNDELLGKLKAQKDELSALKSQFDEIQAAREAAEAEKAEKEGDIAKLREQMEARHKKELEKLAASLEAEKGVNHKLLVENGLSAALTKAGVKPEYMDAAKALLQTQSKIELSDFDGQRAAVVDGKPLAEFVTGWAQGDTGKHFVAAPANSGGNAQGALGADGSGKTITRTAFDGLGHAERAAKVKDGFKVVDEA
jgi:seryl-tRNA synthetase